MVRLDQLVPVLLLLHGCCDSLEKSKIPKVEFEVLKSGGFRGYVPAFSISKFELSVYINREQLRGHTDVPVNDYFIIEFNKKLNIRDYIFYDVGVINKGLHYSKSELSWEVKELLDFYTSLEKCKISTLSKSKDAKCAGQLLMADDFNEPIIDVNKWVVEQWIPTYYGNNGNYEFNSYENVNETRFIRNGILYLKPVAKKNDNEVRGVLDLRMGCTSQDSKQCHYQQTRAYFLPPIKSGRITSKQSFQYGKVEVRAKLPVGDWISPVLQLQLNDSDTETESPKAIIAYSRGNIHLCGIGENNLGSHLLYGGPILSSNKTERNKLLKTRYSAVPYNNGFHVYILEWIPGKMLFYVDSDLYGEVVTSTGFPQYKSDWNKADAPFNKEYFLSLGVSVGGIHDFPDECASGDNPKPWSNTDPKYVKSFFEARHSWLQTWIDDQTALQVDYVKVWAV